MSKDDFICLDESVNLYKGDMVTSNDVVFHKYLMFGHDNALYRFGYGCRIPHMDKEKTVNLFLTYTKSL